MKPTVENLRVAASIFRAPRKDDQASGMSRLAADALDRWADSLTSAEQIDAIFRDAEAKAKERLGKS